MSDGESFLLELLKATDVDGGCSDDALKSAFQDWLTENAGSGLKNLKTINLEKQHIRLDWWLFDGEVEGIFTGRWHKEDRGPREDGEMFVDWLARQIGFDLYLDTK